MRDRYWEDPPGLNPLYDQLQVAYEAACYLGGDGPVNVLEKPTMPIIETERRGNHNLWKESLA